MTTPDDGTAHDDADESVPAEQDDPSAAQSDELDDAYVELSPPRPRTRSAAPWLGRRKNPWGIQLPPAFRTPLPAVTALTSLRRSIDLSFNRQIREAAGLNLAVGPNLKVAPFSGLLGPGWNPFGGIAEKLNKAMLGDWLPSLTRLGEALQKLYPANWGDARPSDWDELRDILAHEGIPLLWVPGPQTVAAIFEAGDRAERRQVISRRWKGIVNDCEKVLDGVSHELVADERMFALECISALRAGHTSSAQALAANLLDSALRRFYSDGARIKLTNNDFKKNGTTFDFDDRAFRTALTFAPVWCAHAKYYPSKGDRIPTQYGRHPSAHAVSRTQYTRINAVIAVMLVTSLIKYFDVELKRRDRA